MTELGRRSKLHGELAAADDPIDIRPEEMKIGKVAIPENSSQGLEMLHSASQNLVVVCGVVEDGPWGKWNETHPKHMVQPGDEIVEVNGKRGEYTAVVQELTAKSHKTRLMTMVIRRPMENRVMVYKPEGNSLGLVLVPLDNGLLFIDAVSAGGCIDNWNKKNPDRKVRSLDQIVEVNNVRGSALDLVEAMKKESYDLELVFLTHL